MEHSRYEHALRRILHTLRPYLDREPVLGQAAALGDVHGHIADLVEVLGEEIG